MHFFPTILRSFLCENQLEERQPHLLSVGIIVEVHKGVFIEETDVFKALYRNV